ncbi:MAG TPA: chemotaxis protein CheB [Polyangiaceae bacterium]|nr:chemotaxis protein CheB [Polyangiaceae bacterium]
MEAIRAIVGIGASLGGLTACRQVLWDLPSNFPAPILIVQHRLAEAEPLLAGLLGKEDGLRVVEPDDKALLSPGTVYVAPSNYHMLVEQGGTSIALSTEGVVRYARPSIDVLFESMAATFGRGAVAVVLTGSSDDGARGAQAVKRAGGRVIVQTPTQAESRIAPAAAIARMKPDAVVDVEAIAPLLRSWLRA